MTLSPQFLDELRTRTLLSGVVGKAVKLQRAGREFKACCPFHQEKTPSFYVNDDKGFYHCFGCSAHGDAIRFVTETQGLSFIDAVKELAQAAGMTVPAPDPRSAERAERAAGLHDVVAAAAKWFEAELAGIGGGEAREYLKRRGLSDAIVREFALGFAPDSRSRLRTALAKHGVERLVETGLLIAPEGTDKESYDRFRGRLIFPIRDPRGRAIGFGGRILGPGEPKYLNSPDTPLFDKGRTLYNLDRAAPASRTAKRIIVVEGYMDVIALAQAGIAEVVASSGTALTEGQMERLWRLDPLPILCFDGDAAGQRAAAKAAIRALPFLAPERSLRFATMPPGQDPDDVVRGGGRAAFETLVATPEPLVDRLWRHELDAIPLTTPEARAGLRRRLGEHAQAIGDGDVRGQYQAEFRRRFDALYAERRPEQGTGARRFQPFRPQPAPASAQARSIGGSGIDPMLARAVLGGLIRFPAAIATHAEALASLETRDPALDALRERLLDSAFGHAKLEAETLAPILAEAGLGALAKELSRSNGLAFSFLRGDADPERARRDLGEAIEVLVSRPLIEAALAEATARFRETTDDGSFAEQRRLHDARSATEARLVELMRADDGTD